MENTVNVINHSEISFFMVDERGFFKFNVIAEKYNEQQMIEDLGLSPEEKIADGYGHAKTCQWFIQECKTSQIKRALEQLESTARQLFDKGRPVDRLFIIGKRISRTEKRIYQRDCKSLRIMKKLDGINQTPVIICGLEVHFIDESTLSGGNVLWHFS